MPLREDNAYELASLYFFSQYKDGTKEFPFDHLGDDYEWNDYDQTYDYDYYMTGMEEWSKYEVHFKCVKVEEQTPEPTPELTTLEQSTINSFYADGLDQENLTIFCPVKTKDQDDFHWFLSVRNKCLNIKKVTNDWKVMLQDATHSWWKHKVKDLKKERLQEKFEKLVKRVRERHDKMVEKGCTFAKINQSAGAREHFVNHGKMCESMGAYLKGKR